jgi:hypothetical protein
MTTPTDAELVALLPTKQLERNKEPKVQVWLTQKDALEFARAVLAKWGQSQAVASGEPVYWLHRHPDEPNGELCTYRLTPGDKRAGWIEEPVYTAPPPQAVREPLTDEQIGALSCRDGLANVEVPVIQWLVREVEYLHGITKGGQHGAE